MTTPINYKDFSQYEKCWEKFQGSFIEDSREGKGTLFFTNGERFVGYFSQDKIHGRGTFYSKDGGQITGTWKEDELISE